MTVKPFSPADARAAKPMLIPLEVVQAVNEFLAERLNVQKPIRIQPNEIRERAVRLMESNLNFHGASSDFYKRGWFEIESLYRDCGWDVVYVSDGFDSTFESHFKFTALPAEKT